MPCSAPGRAERRARSAWLLAAALLMTDGAIADGGSAADRWRDGAPNRAWSWRAAAPADRPTFRGLVRYDEPGGKPGAMLYPAPNAIGLLAAVITHAAVTSGIRSAEAARFEAQAQEVLTPMQPLLEPLTLLSIQQEAARRMADERQPVLVEASTPGAAPWLIETTPTFLVTPDRRAMLLDAVVTVRDAVDGTVAAERAVRVVAPPLRAEDPLAHWLHGGSAAVVMTGASLLAEAVEMVLADALPPGPPAPQRTVRYVEGGVDTSERGAPFGEACGRARLRTLRGDLMSVPLRDVTTPPATSDCERAWPPLPDVAAPVTPSPAASAPG